ncbi:Transposase [Pseudomonas putida]|nr:Transposase [Pseudomonas putida]
MTKQRRTFTPEFKREAASLVLDQGYSHIDAARSLGLVESALRRWVNQAGTGKIDLKKATALLMAEEHERSR